MRNYLSIWEEFLKGLNTIFRIKKRNVVLQHVNPHGE